MDVSIAFIIARTLERVLIIAIGGASLWMGWQLFLRLQTQIDQQAEFSYKDLKVQLQKVGPGIFFALFGTVLLSISLYNLPSLDNQIAKNQNSASSATIIRMLGANNPQELERMITALNLAINVAETENIREVPVRYLTDFKDGAGAIAVMRNQLLGIRFGLPALASWLKYREEYRSGGRSMDANVLEDVRKVDELASRLNLGRL